MNENEIYFASAIAINHYEPEHPARWVKPIRRSDNFALGDERKVGKRAAFKRAQERASEFGRTQQVRLVEGPLLGQTQWLIQSMPDRHVPVGAEVRLDERYLDPEPVVNNFFIGVETFSDPGDAIESFESEPEVEVRIEAQRVIDYINHIFDGTGLTMVAMYPRSDGSEYAWVVFDHEKNRDAKYIPAAQKLIDAYIDGKVVTNPVYEPVD